MRINKKQKIVFLVGLGIIVLMGLFPPWAFYQAKGSNPGHYGFIFSEEPIDYYGYSLGDHIDIIRLLLQWVIVVVATAGIMFVLKDDTGRAQK